MWSLFNKSFIDSCGSSRGSVKATPPPKPIFESGTIQVRSSGAATPRKSAPANTATPGDVPGNAPAKAVQSKGIAT